MIAVIKILSLDGGPGPLLELRVIERLQRRFEQFSEFGSFLDQADVFAGTSNGGLMALYLARGLTEAQADREAGRTPRSSAEIIDGCLRFSDDYVTALAPDTHHVASLLDPFGAMRELAVERAAASELRQSSVGERLRRIARLPMYVAGSLGEIWKLRRTIVGKAALSHADALERRLVDAFGDWRLGDLTRKVVVLSFDTTAWKPRAFRNFWAANGAPSDRSAERDRARDEALPLVEVGMSTAAMPLFLPVYGGSEDRGYLDGIFSANNPCASAVTLVMRHLIPPDEPHPLDQIVTLSMGVSQTAEEANIERSGGLGALLDLVAVDDRATRMRHSIPPGAESGYFTDPAVQRQVHTHAGRKNIGDRDWGWRDYLARPTFVANMLVHGMNGEATAQAERLLRERFFRHAPRIQLARCMYRMLFMGRTVRESELPRSAAVCLREPFGHSSTTPETRDEERNARDTDRLLAWLVTHWFSLEHVARADAAE